MTLETIYTVAKDIVKRTPQNGCLSPNGFAVLTNDVNLGKDDWGFNRCDINSPYFYSRITDNEGDELPRASYPAIIMDFSIGDISSCLEDISIRTCYELSIMAVDQYQTDCKDCGCEDCGSRSDIRVYRDLNKVLVNFLHQLVSVKGYELPDGMQYMPEETFNGLFAGQYYPVRWSFADNVVQEHKGFHYTPFTTKGLLAAGTTLKFCLHQCLDKVVLPVLETNSAVYEDCGSCQ